MDKRVAYVNISYFYIKNDNLSLKNPYHLFENGDINNIETKSGKGLQQIQL